MPKPNETPNNQDPQDQGQGGGAEESTSAFFNFPLDRNPGDPAPEKEDSKDSQGQDDQEDQDGQVAQDGDKTSDSDDQQTEDAEDQEGAQDEKQEGDEGQDDAALDSMSEEDLNKLSPKERGMYFALKKERDARREAEKERDYLRLQQKFGPKPETPDEEKDDQEGEEQPQDPTESLFKDKADDDYVSVADVRQMLKSMQEASAKKEQLAVKQQEKAQKQHAQALRQADAVDKHLRSTLKSYDEAMFYADEMMKKRPGNAMEFAHLVRTEGAEAAARYAYELGKDHRDFGSGKFVAKKDKNVQNRENAQRAIKNAEKPRTSANAGPGNRTSERYSQEELEDMDASELASTLASMSMNEFRRVPKRLRDKALMAS